MYRILAIGALLLCAGCSTTAERNSSNQARIVGIESISESALKEVMASPTTFRVPVAEVQPQWERARMFYLQYLGAGSVAAVEHTTNAGQAVLNNESIKTSKYIYEVTRDRLTGGEVQIAVACIPNATGSDKNNARRNAKNLSRFIREGTLELSFLDL